MITQVNQKWPRDRLLINYSIHNVCNYKCWYCFPGSNEGDYRWPDLDLVTQNFLHLLKYYKDNLGKTKFQVNLLGGEPTLWPKLSTFVRNLKNELGDDISIMITTNGSRTVNWWETNGTLFDHVLISCHPKVVDATHVSAVADILYEKNVHVDVAVLMDPTRWERTMEIIAQLKNSRRRWSIIASQIIHQNINYTADQTKYLKRYLKRFPNLFWYWRVNKEYNYKTTITHHTGKIQKIAKNYLLTNNLNHFQGWECNIGIDNITVNFNGNLTGSCSQSLYKLDRVYNLYDADFIQVFNPVLQPTICNKISCDCQHEYNTSKRALTTKRVIPIKHV